MPIKTLGLILYAAYHSMQPCETVFVELAKASNPALELKVEQVYLDEFAKAACETSNPDALWLLAKQESNFRFLIVRENSKKPKIHEGQAAINLLAKLKANPDEPRYQSIDIGALQFNWRWHREAFHDDPIAAVAPKAQVDYFLNKYSHYIYKRCDDRWVGCYHNQANPEVGAKYQASVLKRNTKFAILALYYLRDVRLSLSEEERAELPAIETEDFYQVFHLSRSFPLPKKIFDTLATDP